MTCIFSSASPIWQAAATCCRKTPPSSPHAFILDDNDQIVPAKAPLNLYSTIRKRVGMQKINPAYNFAKIIAGNSGRDMLMVVNARGGSALNEWLKGAPTGTFSIRGTDDPELDGKPMPSTNYKKST